MTRRAARVISTELDRATRAASKAAEREGRPWRVIVRSDGAIVVEPITENAQSRQTSRPGQVDEHEEITL